MNIFDHPSVFPDLTPRMYRIYTAMPKTSLSLMRKLTSHYFPNGVTWYPAEGIWQGRSEHSIVIAVAEKQTQYEAKTDRIPFNVLAAANFIIGYLSQEAVGIERPDGRFELLWNELGKDRHENK
jgi:hypothetical protein